jgi:predicted DCC family thiol-disulfide oxidoreductase YuxK
MIQLPSLQSDMLPIMLYDGECGLCDKSLRFVLEHEQDDRMHFTPLQSDLGRQILTANGLGEDYRDSILLIDAAGKLHTHSDAALKIARYLQSPYHRLGWFRVVPSGLRDVVYRFVAAIRIQVFGTADASTTCSLLPPEQRKRIHL